MKNEDLTKISSELYRYYYRIKESHAKALELVDLLQSFDKEFDEKIKGNSDTRLFITLISKDFKIIYFLNEKRPVQYGSSKRLNSVLRNSCLDIVKTISV